jgi:hypothetical protein
LISVECARLNLFNEVFKVKESGKSKMPFSIFFSFGDCLLVNAVVIFLCAIEDSVIILFGQQKDKFALCSFYWFACTL